MDCVCLDRPFPAQLFHAPILPRAEFIIAHSAGNHSPVTSRFENVGKIRGSAAELFARGQHLPQKFAESTTMRLFSSELAPTSGFRLCCTATVSASFSSRSASPVLPNSGSLSKQVMRDGIVGIHGSARCKARTARAVSPFFSSTFPIRMYGPVSMSQRICCKVFSVLHLQDRYILMGKCWRRKGRRPSRCVPYSARWPWIPTIPSLITCLTGLPGIGQDGRRRARTESSRTVAGAAECETLR